MTHCTRIGIALLGWALLMAAIAVPAIAISVGDTAPNFTLYDLEGMPHQLTAFATHPVLLFFLDCQGDASKSIASQIQSSIYDSYASRGLYLRGIECARGNASALGRFRTEAGVQFPLLLNGEGTLDVYDIPVNSIVLVNGEGTVSYIGLGPGVGAYNEAPLRAAVEEALREANDTKTITWGLIRSLYK